MKVLGFLVFGLVSVVGCTTERPPDNAVAFVAEDPRLYPMIEQSMKQFASIYPNRMVAVASWDDVPDGWWPINAFFSREETKDGTLCDGLVGLGNRMDGTVRICENMSDEKMGRVLTHEICHTLGAPGGNTTPHWDVENGACSDATSGVLQVEEKLLFMQLWSEGR